MGGIDTSRIDAMVAQLKAVSASMSAGVANPVTPAANAPAKLDFAAALKSSLDQVNAMDSEASKLSEKFTMGDNSVSLSDVMISSQKANISLQATIQARNKLVSAYHDIMNMQI